MVVSRILSSSRAAPPHGNPDIGARCDRMEGEIRALTTDFRATKDDLRGAMDEIKAKKCGVGSSKRKNHKNVAKGGSKAAVSWTAGTFPTITLGLASVAALLLMTLSSTRGQWGPLEGGGSNVQSDVQQEQPDEQRRLGRGDGDRPLWSSARVEEGKWGPCRHHYYAVRDAIAGEELLISYGEFETTIARYETSWRGRRTLP